MIPFITKKQKLFTPTLIFLSIEALIYTAYLTLDFLYCHTLKLSDGLKYTGIFICFIYTLYLYIGPMKIQHQTSLLLCAFLVLFSDYYLLFTNAYLPGIFIFGVVQCLYFIRQTTLGKLSYYIRLSLLLSAPTALFFMEICGLQGILVGAGSIYMSMLSINIAYALHRFFRCKSPGSGLFALGMVLYSLCDLNVGLMNIPAFFTAQTPGLLHILETALFQEITTCAMWLFYLPAQILIALSIPATQQETQKSRPASSKHVSCSFRAGRNFLQ